MTDLDIAAIRARTARASEGPWWVEPSHTYGGRVYDAYVAYGTPGEPSDTYDLFERYDMADYEFIAAARTDIPALCDAVDRLTAERDALRDALARYGRHDRMCLPHQDGTCDCGFDQVRALGAATGGQYEQGA